MTYLFAQWLPLIVAQAEYEPQRVSLLKWAFMSLGLIYSALLVLAGLALFVGAVIVVIAARRPGVIAAYLVFVPLPLLISAWAAVEGLVQSLGVIAMSAAAPKPAEVAEGIATALFSVLAGLLAMMPGYLVAAAGLFIRTLLWRPPTNSTSST